MPARRRSRQRALQSLYQWDLRSGEGQGISIDDAIENYYSTLWSEEETDQPTKDGFFEALARSTVQNRTEIDGYIERHASNWRIERMPFVDRNILRLAVCELLVEPTPPAVVIDEALEMSRRFANEESVKFINGVLDAIYQTLKRSDKSKFHRSETAGGATTAPPTSE